MAMTIAKWALILFIAFVLFHWFTAGQSTIIEGPPEIFEDGVCVEFCRH